MLLLCLLLRNSNNSSLPELQTIMVNCKACQVGLFVAGYCYEVKLQMQL